MANITKKTNKSGEVVYRIRVSNGYSPDGKQRMKSMTWKPDAGMTQRQIEKELNRQVILFESQVENEVTFQKRVKFSTLADEWLESVTLCKSLNISTIERMKSCKERTYKALGNYYVDAIDFRMIKNFIFPLANDGVNKTTGKGLSEKTQKHYLTFVSDVMKYAMLCNIVTKNPCQGVPVVKTGHQEREPYTIEEEIALIERLKEAPVNYRVFFYFMIYGGLRRSEVCGLEWKDIDFNTGVCSIVRTSQYRGKNTGVYTSTPKTKSSQRSLKLPQEVLTELRKLKFENNAQRVNCGDQWVETDRLFIQWNGEAMHPNTPYWWLQKFCEKENLPFKGVHAFRHSFATQAILNAKVDVKTVSAILGHAQTSTTLEIYAHAFQEANAQALDSVANLFRKETNVASK